MNSITYFLIKNRILIFSVTVVLLLLAIKLNLNLDRNQSLAISQNQPVIVALPTYYVSPSGQDSNNGKSTETSFGTIQKAVDLAQAGETISIASGIYLQNIITKRDGRQDALITINGPPDAIVKGGGDKGRIIEVSHNYIVLQGFTVDGQFGSTEDADGVRGKLIYVLGGDKKSGVTGLKILNMTVKNSGGECIRLRYFARNNEIAYNNIQNCGMVDFRFDGDGKNGEGIYIGTAPEQLKDGKNPTSDTDQSDNNWIHHNNINTSGNECVDIKEGSSGNIVEFNKCTGQQDPESGGMDSRGSHNTFRNNEIFNNIGSGVRLGGDGITDGISNNVYNNAIYNNRSGGVKILRAPQGNICGNNMLNNSNGETTGIFGKLYNPGSACSG